MPPQIQEMQQGVLRRTESASNLNINNVFGDYQMVPSQSTSMKRTNSELYLNQEQQQQMQPQQQLGANSAKNATESLAPAQQAPLSRHSSNNSSQHTWASRDSLNDIN